jgi:hypothetical protein
MTTHRPLITFAVALFALGLAAGCGSAKQYEPASSAPAAGADPKLTVNISEDTRQTRLSMVIPNLAPPSRLVPGGAYYLAWYRRDEAAPWQRIGALTYDEGDRVGKLADTTVPEVAFDVKVTVESSLAAEEPSKTIVTTQHVSK